LDLAPITLQPEHRYGWLDAGSVRLGINGTHRVGRASSPDNRLSIEFEVKSLSEEMTRLEALGCEFFDVQNDEEDGYRMARFRDPEGNAIGIYQLLDA
ncbi:MAG TPA: VOC family protein, partial [Candidatus Kapabacteria bacterium]|nr:VOC family protein [Candidatus Kapabacteria bacterium]